MKEVLSLTAVGNRRTLTLLAALLVGLTALFVLVAQPAKSQATNPQPTSYAVKDLGYVGLAYSLGSSKAIDINDAGEVVGGGVPHAFLYKDGEFTDLSQFLVNQSFPITLSRAFGINNVGQVVGWEGWLQQCLGGVFPPPNPPPNCEEQTPRQAFLYKEGEATATDLGPVLGGNYSDYYSEAWEINDVGQVVGRAQVFEDGQYRWHAFLRNNDGQVIDLHTPGPDESVATDINDDGQVVGTLEVVAFLYKDGQLKVLDGLKGSVDMAFGINNVSEVVGVSQITNEAGLPTHHAFLYNDNNGETTDLGTLPEGVASVATDINDDGQVVGWSDLPGTESGGRRAFLYENGEMTDLNSLIPTNSGWVLETADAINKEGQIVGTGTKEDGWKHLFLLTLSDTTPPTLSLPADITQEATGPDGAAVTYTATANDTVDGPVTPSCSPSSGSIFPIGETMVSCSATDQAGNTAGGSFKVIVKGAEEQITDLGTMIQDLNLLQGTEDSLLDKLKTAQEELAAGNKEDACGALGALINEVKALSKKKSLSTAQANALIEETNRIRAVLGCT